MDFIGISNTFKYIIIIIWKKKSHKRGENNFLLKKIEKLILKECITTLFKSYIIHCEKDLYNILNSIEYSEMNHNGNIV